MGLFNKDKENSAPSAPPAPGMPPAPMNNQGSTSMPPAPNPSGELAPTPGLPTPPTPGASLEDIKSQVSSTPAGLPEPSMNQLPVMEPISPTPETEEKLSDSEDDELDSLFDISDLELPDSDEEETHIEESPTAIEHTEETPTEQTEVSTQFIGHHKEINETKPFFVTTSQFKALLEIIENVKQKTKESSERHLRLLDIKSEEDIEYENLKKDFAFIEDKLYEVDTLIFEND